MRKDTKTHTTESVRQYFNWGNLLLVIKNNKSNKIMEILLVVSIFFLSFYWHDCSVRSHSIAKDYTSNTHFAIKLNEIFNMVSVGVHKTVANLNIDELMRKIPIVCIYTIYIWFFFFRYTVKNVVQMEMYNENEMHFF